MVKKRQDKYMESIIGIAGMLRGLFIGNGEVCPAERSKKMGG